MEQAINTKAEKFRIAAPEKVSRAMRAIQRVGNLARRGGYTAEQIDKIFATLRQELDAAEKKFNPIQTNFRWDD